MFYNASNIDASHSTFSEVHRDQHICSRTHVQGNQTVNTIVHGNQVLRGSLGLGNLYRASAPGAAFDSIDRHPAPACLPGTRHELLALLAQWIDNPSRDERLCWLSGLAGSGKSAIAQSIAGEYASRRRLAASFFFSRKEMSRRKAHGFFPTLACQMLISTPSIKPALLDALDADATLPTKVLLEQARRLLQEPIMSSGSSFPDPVLIVVDSLDECDDVRMGSEIVHLLAGILCRSHWPLKVLFTSRAEPHIISTFQHPELRSMTRSFHLRDFDADDDIRAYLRHSFEAIRESMYAISVKDDPQPWPSEGDLELIVEKAAGLFIFATTVVKYVGIDYGSPVMQLQGVLQVLRDGASAETALVHSPLDALYLDALCRIPDVEKVRLILGLVVFAFRPLSTHGLSDLLWNSRFDASYVAKSLCSVLVISGSDIESDGAVHIYHTSFHDFLTSPHRSRQYFVDPVDFHSTLARACLELMIRHLRVDMCGLGDPSILNSEIEGLDKRCKLRIKESVRYACRWFAHHLAQVPWERGPDDALVLSLQVFARGHLLNWIEMLSLTNELNSAILSLREAMDWLKRSPKRHEETLTLLRDTERLVLMCYDLIQQAPLQVYYSLPYAPTHVQIRKSYAHELKNKFVITHGLDGNWKSCIRCVSTGFAVKSIAISSSGRLIASAGDAPGVQLWDTLSGSNIGHFYGNGTSTCPVVFSPSGDYVVIGYDTGAIDTWDVTTGQRLLDLGQSIHKASVTVLAVSPNSFFVASGAADATVYIWDTSTRILKYSLTYQKGPISCLSFSPDNGLIASGSDDGSIRTSGVDSGQLVHAFRGHTFKVNSISFSSDGGNIASGSDDESVRLWDTRTGVCLRTFTGMHKKPIRQVWMTADNKYIVSVCNMDIYMWETNSRYRKPAKHIWSVNHFFRKAMTMFPAWYAKFVRLVPVGLLARLAGTDHDTTIYAVPSPDGDAVACTWGSFLFYLEHSASSARWSKVRYPVTTPSTTDEPPLFVDDSNGVFTAVTMTPDAALLVTSSDKGDIKMCSTSPGSSWEDLYTDIKRAVTGFWPAPDCRSLLVEPMVGHRLFVHDGRVIRDLGAEGDTNGAVDAVPSPDSRYFAFWAKYAWSVDKSFSILIYNASTGVRLKRISGFFDITCARFSAESDLFACAHGRGVVQVWELPSVLCKTTITTYHAVITALQFLPGCITLAMGSDAGCVEIRLVENGDVLYHINCSPSKVLTLAVPNEALIMIVGQEDGSIFVWDPSYTDVAAHCLSPKSSRETPSDANSHPDGVDFISFTKGYRSICTRSTNGVTCTWDLTRCLAEYSEPAMAAKAILSESAYLPGGSDRSDDSSGPTALDHSSSRQDNGAVPRASDCTSASYNEASGPVPEELTASTIPATILRTPRSPCPHLVSRSDSHIVYDRYICSAYSIDGRQGWVYRGTKRLFWLPNDLRPASPMGLAAVEDRLLVLARSQRIVCFDLRPMVDPTQALCQPGGQRDS